MRKLNLIFKRLIDFLGSLFGILLLSPLFIIIILSVKLTSRGPAFFRQERVGKDGTKFKIVKFRTMVINAEKIGDGLFVKSEEDNRITRIGKFLRSSSLDELPQLWNVLIGEMSLVGPRPPVPHHPRKFEDYSHYQRKRFEMRPGMTGLTQVTVRNSVSWDDRIVVDVEYVENFNIWLDVKILLRTIQKMFVGESIYLNSENEQRKTSKVN